MKLITLLLITTIMQVSANAYAQKINLSEKNAPLIKVFNDISSQTGFDFLFTAQTLRNANLVNIDVNNTDLSIVLQKIFNGQSLKYEIQNKTIVVSQQISLKTKTTSDVYGDLKGTVTDSLGKPLFGATIKISGPSSGVSTTNEKGNYSISRIPAGTYLVTISYIGYTTFKKDINIGNEIGANSEITLNVALKPSSSSLTEVTVSTGYQTLPKERATGSFEVLNNSQFNRIVSPNLIDHLDGSIAGVHFDSFHNGTNTFQGSYTSYPQGTPQFNIRGLSTINSSSQPLIVLDNFPYTGDINSINPNDVESITVLKDAAAASIWGARAGNGVVVITTKKGKYNQKPTVDFNSSVTIGNKPNLFSQRQISTKDYIGLEQSLFNQGKYDAYNNADPTNNFNGGRAVSDVVNILFAEKNGTITKGQGDAQIAALSNNDVRNDYLKYYFRHSINQQYELNVRGGSEQNRYYVSAGYDNDQATNYSSQQHFTFSAGNTYRPFRNVELSIPVYVTNNKQIENSAYDQNASGISPYSRLVDNKGNAINVPIANGYSKQFISKADAAGLYDLSYNPIHELHDDQFLHTTVNQVRFSPEIKYSLPLGFSADMQYQYSKAVTTGRKLQSDSTFYTRNLIDQFTQIDATGNLTYPINRGGILSLANSQQVENFLRGTLSYNHTLGNDHRIDFIGGYESDEITVTGNQNYWYGYNPSSGTEQTNVDYNSYFNNTIYSLSGLPFQFTQQIPSNNQGVSELFTAYKSVFANGAYTYKDKYILSGSARIDRANLYGLNTNLKKKALWSIGGSWIVNQESFYHLDWLPMLKLRATYGFQGNPPLSGVTSLATINYYSPTANSSGLPYATLSGLPNPNLTWEKVGQLNLGLDFGLKNDVITGSFEYYQKKSSDLIASYNIEPTTGASSQIGNVASLKGNGIDINLVSQNVRSKNFKWSSRLLFSRNTDKVTKYLLDPTTFNTIFNYPSPITGNAVYGLYSYKWGGLDSKGNPQGYDADGKISEDYNNIINNTPVKSLVYNGRINPSVFGSFINEFSYKDFTISANITYEAGFYFRATSVNYSNLYGQNMLGSALNGADYSKRWQKPGDEKTTYVPSAPALDSVNYYRDEFYQYSSVLVQKGDNIRLKDISASYNLGNAVWMKNSPFSSFQLYSYYNPNIIIWRANKLGIDPDYQVIKPVKTITFGIRAILK